MASTSASISTTVPLLLLLLLLSAGTEPSLAQDTASTSVSASTSTSVSASTQLPGTYARGVELVLQQLNSHASVQHHFLFFRTVTKSDIQSGFGVKFVHHHFLLKPTVCPKGSAASDAPRCPFRNDRPLMDCTVCYKLFGDEMESSPKPYVHCIQKPKLTQGMRASRINHCSKMSYSSGAPTLLAVST